MRRSIVGRLDIGLWVVLSAAAAAIYEQVRLELPWWSTTTLIQVAFAVAAWFVLATLGGLIPSLFPSGPMRFPFVATLPIAHASVLVTMVVLFTNAKSGIQQIPEPLKAALIWTQIPTILGMVILSAALLGVVASTSK
ncbi:MAG TPA: hypothetical protein PKA27_05320 [Fimbriimonadaceae bacterium]|nr:hypothetical protein [Fimbriimonadaceae bacterium]